MEKCGEKCRGCGEVLGEVWVSVFGCGGEVGEDKGRDLGCVRGEVLGECRECKEMLGKCGGRCGEVC